MIEIFFNDFLKYIFPFILLSSFIGILSFPISQGFFRRNFDLGYINSIILGYISITWISFLIATLLTFFRIEPSYPIFYPSLIISITIWGVVNVWYFKHLGNYQNFKACFEKSKISFTILILLIFTVLIYLVNSFNYIYNPTGSENHMNLAILNSINYSNKVPINDFWYSGYPLNYYYFSHYILASISFVLSLIPNRDFTFIGVIFPALFLTALSNLVLTIIQNNLEKISKLQVTISILLTTLITLFINPIKTIYGLYEFIFTNKSLDFFVQNFSDYTVRIIPYAITENFNYPILINAIHALTSGLIIGILIINSLYYFILDSEKISLKNKYLFLIFTLIGFAGLINTWDILVYLGLIISAVTVYKQVEFLKNPFQNIKSLILCLYPTIVIMAPWFIFFESPGGTPSIVHNVSNIIDLFSFWGIYLILYILLIFNLRQILEKHNFILFLSSLGILLILFLEIFYFKDALSGGNYFRANTYYKISNLILLFFSIGFSIFLFLYLYKVKSNYILKTLILCLILLTTWFNYPLMVFKSRNFIFTGIQNQEKLVENYSYNLLEIIKYLEKNKLPNMVILEGGIDGGYKFTNFVSVFTGIPTVLGWGNHELTWRNTNTFNSITIEKFSDVKEIYTGEDIKTTTDLLKKYSVDYIVISQSEREIYLENLNEKKLEQLGEKVIEKGNTKLIKIN